MESTNKKFWFWPSLLVCIGTIPLFVVIAYVSFYIMIDSSLEFGQEYGRDIIQEWIEQNRTTPIGFLKMAAPINITVLLLTYFLAVRSKIPWKERLGLVNSSIPIWQYFLFILGGLGANTIGAWIYYPLVSPVVDGAPGSLVYSNIGGIDEALIVLYAATVVAVSEEVLFRGYIMRGLLQRWKPIVVIGICSLVYMIAHTNPFFPYSALPMGIWLAIVSWHTQSIWPAIVCHSIGTIGMAIILSYYPNLSVSFFEEISFWPIIVGIFCIIILTISIWIIFKRNEIK